MKGSLEPEEWDKICFLCPQIWNHSRENRLSWLLPLKGVNSFCFIIVDFSLQLLWPRQSSKQHGGPYSDRPAMMECTFGLQILRGRFCRPPPPQMKTSHGQLGLQIYEGQSARSYWTPARRRLVSYLETSLQCVSWLDWDNLAFTIFELVLLIKLINKFEITWKLHGFTNTWKFPVF